ncbi:hypothetical protein SAMN05518801_101237 [Novosphingobium sp. CF614]|uniref:hypothetical protein n=1 Tax=Novosphingobium sp. CF614 TaxID=1884364 RepID=UPI0008E4BFE2|nr:hypothetical protein [Novosphingobium sp. CF614]SFF75176.1 hypothetical protein SAMN05518801_101237 [Novosphingobium sp. CF614]
MSQHLNRDHLRDLAVVDDVPGLAPRQRSARGIDTPGGRLTVGDAAGRVLMLPVLILG